MVQTNEGIQTTGNIGSIPTAQHTNSTNDFQMDEKNSKLLKGIIIGGVVGGVLTLLDSTTRNQVKGKAMDLKNSSVDMWGQIRENPQDVKNQMIQQFKSATNSLKDAISEAQGLYERVNDEVLGKVSDTTNDTISTLKDSKADLKSIGSKVAEAGSELKGVVDLEGTNSLDSSDDTSTSRVGTVRTAVPENIERPTPAPVIQNNDHTKE